MSTPVDLAKLRSVGVIGRRSGPVVAEVRADDGTRTRAVTDELGHTVTEHTKPGTGVSHRQDVQIAARTVTLKDGR